jgi:hypothetical protein
MAKAIAALGYDIGASARGELPVFRDGAPFHNVDFNLLFVSSPPEGNRFTASCHLNGKHYPIRGDVSWRTATVLHENAEDLGIASNGTQLPTRNASSLVVEYPGNCTFPDPATGRCLRSNEAGRSTRVDGRAPGSICAALGRRASSASTDVSVASALWKPYTRPISDERHILLQLSGSDTTSSEVRRSAWNQMMNTPANLHPALPACLLVLGNLLESAE